MPQLKLANQGSSISIVVFASICIVVFGMGSISPKSANRGQQTIQQVNNKTQYFEVTEVNCDLCPRIVELSLRNGYVKNITAYAVSVNGFVSAQDFRYSDGEDQIGISPNAVFSAYAGVSRSGNPDIAARQGLNITVLAVIFDDKTSDGDPKIVTHILDTRQGSKIQLERVIGLVNKTLQSKAEMYDSDIDQLKIEISSLSTASRNPTELAQLRSEKDSALWRLNRIAADLGSASVRERLIRFKEACQSLASRL
jgi:hypothetical protein